MRKCGGSQATGKAFFSPKPAISLPVVKERKKKKRSRSYRAFLCAPSKRSDPLSGGRFGIQKSKKFHSSKCIEVEFRLLTILDLGESGSGVEEIYAS